VLGHGQIAAAAAAPGTEEVFADAGGAGTEVCLSAATLAGMGYDVAAVGGAAGMAAAVAAAAAAAAAAERHVVAAAVEGKE